MANAKTPVLAVNPAFKGTYSGARATWQAAMAPFVGKPVTAFTASIAANGHPTMPKTGKLQGKPEPVAGWVSFLTSPSGKNQQTPAYIIK